MAVKKMILSMIQKDNQNDFVNTVNDFIEFIDDKDIVSITCITTEKGFHVAHLMFMVDVD